MSSTHYIPSFIISISLLFLCIGSTAQRFVTVDGNIFRDTSESMIILKGLNYVNKDKSIGFLNKNKDRAFKDLKRWGYNSVRLGIIWSALEPEPGRYDSVYLHDLDQRIEYARQNGIYVVLDMHQDLFSEKFGDGAPAWATLDEGKPHITGGIWSDAYFISPAVQTAFDNFWKNTAINNGIGVQDYYAQTWAMIADRYKCNNTVVGFDIMNEPFIGSGVEDALGALLAVLTEAMNKEYGSKKYTLEEVGQMWMDENGKGFILSKLESLGVFVKALKSMEPVYKKFEEEKLQPFYEKVATAMRKVNNHQIFFFEPSVSTNNGIPTYLNRIQAAGEQQGFMPHFYDVVMDTKLAAQADAGRLNYMFDNLSNMQERLKLPMMIGEWGAFYSGGKELLNAASIMSHGIDSLLIGDFYWSYFEGLKDQPYFKEILQRPYMQTAKGKMLSQKVSGNTFHVSWQEEKRNKGKNIIYLPASGSINLQPKTKYKSYKLNDYGGYIIEIKPMKKNKTRTLEIDFQHF